MNVTGWLVAAAIAAVGGAWLIVTGWRQPRPTIERSMRHLRRSTPAEDRHIGRRSIPDRVGHALVDRGVAGRTAEWRQSLHLIGRTPEQHTGLLALSALAGFFVPMLLLASLQFTGVVSIGVFVPLGLSLVAAILAPLAVHADAVGRAATTKLDLRHQLSGYLDVVAMLLAGNTGHEGALEQAAQAGDGLLFRELRRRMREVGATGTSLIRALELVGDDYGLVELEQVAATASLTAAEGAPVARALSAKCATLRSTLAAEQEAIARVRNDKVTPPLVGMALLFMALIIYPALNLN